MIEEVLLIPLWDLWLLITLSITVVKIYSLLFAIPCTYNKYQNVHYILVHVPCLWTRKFSSCISINCSGFSDLHSAMHFQVGCVLE